MPIAAGRQRTLLAALLLNANEIVPVEELVERLWGDRLPHRPRSALHTLLTRLRQRLEQGTGDQGTVIRTSAAGYVIETAPDRIDLMLFRNLVEQARREAERRDLARESTLLARALSLWRGPVLSDVRSDSLHRDVLPKLTEEQLWALDRRCDVDLLLGRHHELVGELRSLIRRYPFHEGFWRQLMLALYRCSRRVEALEVYGEVRDRLRDELGLDPTQVLNDLHMAILRDDPGLSMEA